MVFDHSQPAAMHVLEYIELCLNATLCSCYCLLLTTCVFFPIQKIGRLEVLEFDCASSNCKET